MRDEDMGMWEELERPAPESVTVGGVEVRQGSRVRLRPRPGGDVFDIALAGKAAVVEGIDQDFEGNIHVAVTIEEDPGRDLGEDRQPGHRFFFSVEEVEPLAEARPVLAPAARVLVAGIGNVFLGDDGFGVEMAARLTERKLPPGVDVGDFGIRGMDLAYALQEYDVAIFVDAVPRGEAPGTLYVIEPDLEDSGLAVDTHGMDPVKVIGLARALGGPLPRVLVVGCEPATHMNPDEEEMAMELSEPVRAALDEAVRLVESVLDDVTVGNDDERKVSGS